MATTMKQLLVYGEKTFKITIPADAKVTYGPFSPPTKGQPYDSDKAKGTLRVYQGGKDNIIACFAGVRGFRDLSMGYAEEVAKEEGAVIWKSDKDGYQREEKVRRDHEWLEPHTALPAPKGKKSGKKGLPF